MVLLILAGGAPKTFGESEAPPAPPLVGRAPDSASWTITVNQKVPLPPKSSDPKTAEYQDMLAKVNPRLLKETVEKAGGNLHQETYWESGAKDIFWFYQGYVIFQTRMYPPDQVVIMAGTNKNAPLKPNDDFPELDWITPKVFAGTTTHDGVKCYLYTKNDPKLGSTSVWIDFDSRLPIAVESPATLNTYTFSSGPVSIVPQGIFATRYQLAMKAVDAAAHSTEPR